MILLTAEFYVAVREESVSSQTMRGWVVSELKATKSVYGAVARYTSMADLELTKVCQQYSSLHM